MGPTIEMFNDLSVYWSGPILRATWQGGLAIAAAWILVRGRPGLPPRVACWLWRLADFKLIIALLWGTPILLPLLPPSTQSETLPGTFALAHDLQLRAADVPEPTTEPAGGLAATPATHRLSPALIAFLFWLSGVIGAVFLAGKGWLNAAYLRRSCPLIHCEDVRVAATDLARVLGLRSIPELRAGPVVARPMLVGEFRPAILLPVTMLRDTRLVAVIRSTLAHELAHICRRDLLWGDLAGLVRAMFFFHPLVWLAHREALLAREVACDALALLSSGIRPSDYGQILLDIAAGSSERPGGCAATLGMAGSTGSLKRRLLAMKTTQRPSRRRLMSWAFALLVVGMSGSSPGNLFPVRSSVRRRPLSDTRPISSATTRTSGPPLRLHTG